jgi:hypothetical protein
MERRAILLALALTLPLALYGIPYAYASTTSSSYEKIGDYVTIHTQGSGNAVVFCNSGDYSTGGGFTMDRVPGLSITDSGSTYASDLSHLTGWHVGAYNPLGFDVALAAITICQAPITVAGIGVPQFGSLYVAIALGAVVYFMLSRRFAGRPTISTQA